MAGYEIVSIKIHFTVAKGVERFVFVHAILGEKVYLIDAGVAGAVGQIQEALRGAGRDAAEIEGILLTHTHPDHIGCIAEIKEISPKCKVYVSSREWEWLADIDLQYRQRPIPNFYALAGASAVPDVILRPGDTVAPEEGVSLAVIDCCGHSHGSVGYLWKERQTIFTGDAVPATGDVPIFSSLSGSLATIRRLRDIQNIQCLFSAWEEPKCGGQIAEYLDRAEGLLSGISSAVSRVLQSIPAGFMTMQEKHEAICDDARATPFNAHPLFVRSIQAAMEEYYDGLLRSTCESLKKRGFDAVVCSCASEVRAVVAEKLDTVLPRAVGFGNSQTVRGCEIVTLAEGRSLEIYQHDPRRYSAEEDRQALLSDLYFTSANALSADGHIVNIDGTGNRTGATCCGPREIVYVVGRNKIASNLDMALQRATEAAIRLASSYGRNTPCAKTGKCHDCLAPECVCGVTTIHRHALIGNAIYVILVNEDLGL